MKSVVSIFCISLAVTAIFSYAKPASSADRVPKIPAGSSAEQLLNDVVSNLPKEPLLINGSLNVRKRRGVVVKELGFEMFLNWRDQPSIARYTIRDSFGSDLEQLTVLRAASGKPEFKYVSGNPLTNAPLPDLYKPVQDTDVSWMDLTLSFLWWKGGKVTGNEDIKGRNCYVVEIPVPESEKGGQYSKVVLWIDVKLRMLLQAEGYDSKNKLLRKLWMKSFKKIDDRWMIKDMEIQTYPAVHRTKLRVREVKYNNNTPD